MESILLTLILLSTIAGLTLSTIFMYRIYKGLRDVRGNIEAYITPTADGKPSPLASTVDAVSSVFARSFVAQAKTTFMGVESGTAKREKSLQGDIALDVARNAGGLAGLLTQFPTVAKSIRRNPGLVDAALQLLAKQGQTRENPGNGYHSEDTQLKIL